MPPPHPLINSTFSQPEALHCIRTTTSNPRRRDAAVDGGESWQQSTGSNFHQGRPHLHLLHTWWFPKAAHKQMSEYNLSSPSSSVKARSGLHLLGFLCGDPRFGPIQGFSPLPLPGRGQA